MLHGVETRNDRVNLGLVVLKSEAIMLGSVYIVKTLTHVARPDGSDNLSFPSGHTAQAFLAASIVHTEFRDKSQWYGIGAYTLATSVAAFRMINDKHWESDVIAGAGFGILSAHLAYLSHRNRWGRKPTLLVIGLLYVVSAVWSALAGDVFSFIEKYEKVGFKEALAILARRANIPLEEASPQERARVLAGSGEEEAVRFEVLRMSQRCRPNSWCRKATLGRPLSRS